MQPVVGVAAGQADRGLRAEGHRRRRRVAALDQAIEFHVVSADIGDAQIVTVRSQQPLTDKARSVEHHLDRIARRQRGGGIVVDSQRRTVAPAGPVSGLRRKREDQEQRGDPGETHETWHGEFPLLERAWPGSCRHRHPQRSHCGAPSPCRPETGRMNNTLLISGPVVRRARATRRGLSAGRPSDPHSYRIQTILRENCPRSVVRRT